MPADKTQTTSREILREKAKALLQTLSFAFGETVISSIAEQVKNMKDDEEWKNASVRVPDELTNQHDTNDDRS